MILYHGPNVEIERIDLNRCKPYKDFGKGFYLTTLEQAVFKETALLDHVGYLYG